METFYIKIFTNLNFFLINIFLYIIFINWSNRLFQSDLKSIEFFKYNKFKIFSSNKIKINSSIREIIKLKKEFDYSLNKYYIAIIKDNEFIDLIVFKEKKNYLYKRLFKYSITKKIYNLIFGSKYRSLFKINDFNLHIYEVPTKNFHFNNLITLFRLKLSWLSFKKYVYYLILCFPLTIFFFLYFAKYSDNLIGKVNLDYTLYYNEFIFIIYEAIILFMPFLNLMTIILFLIIIYVYFTAKRNLIYSFILSSVITSSLCLFLLYSLLIYFSMCFILKIKEPNSKFIPLNTIFLENIDDKLKDLEIISIKDKRLLKIDFDENFIYYQDLNKNEKSFFKDEQKRFKGDFKNTNCGEFFYNIKNNCKEKDILNCKNENMLTSLIVNNKFFNAKNTEKIPLQYISFDDFTGRKIDINKDINFSRLINQCKIIEKLDYIKEDLLFYELNTKPLPEMLIIEYKKSKSIDEKKYMKKLFYNLDISEKQKSKFELLL